MHMATCNAQYVSSYYLLYRNNIFFTLQKDVEEDEDDGAESHDEGLGSENEEEHHDFNDEEDEDLADDASDISEEIGTI